MYQRFAIALTLSTPCRAARRTPKRMIWSATRKNTLASTTMTNTMTVVIEVSLRVGQVTLAASARTCCRNSNGFVFAILSQPRRRGAAAGVLDWGSAAPAQTDRGAERSAPRHLP